MFADFFFPDRCLSCNRIIAAKTFVCDVCVDQINFNSDTFESENSTKEKCSSLFPTENAFALMDFQNEGLARELMHSLKYGNREKVGKLFADWTTERLQFKVKPDLIIAVPLHPKKEKKRGYNQLHLYCEELSKFYNIPFDKMAMRRDLNTKAQALKNKSGRTRKDHIFTLNKPVEEKHILLIDDVLTTGNTIGAMAWEILKAGKNKISVLIMANDV